MAQLFDLKDDDFESRFQALVNLDRGEAHDVQQVVADIIADVRTRGDSALADYTQKFDRFDVAARGLAVSPAEVESALASIDADVMAALRTAAARIRAFHQRQLPDGLDWRDESGVRLGQQWSAMDAAGLYVPGGTAAYPSSVLMNAIPADVAGVARLVMVVPTPDDQLNPLVLAAAHLAGVSEIYRVGGAQAVAALAYGTESIARVDKIVGPGNAFVAEAKRQVFGRVGIDTIAGPSEILVIADKYNKPEWIAADLLSQAEHDVLAQSILITDDKAFAASVMAAVDEHLKTLPRADIAGKSWADYGAVITVPNIGCAIRLSDQLAPEHLELAVAGADSYLPKIKHAGAVFLGRLTPEALGDYVAGPNHVLPTDRAARFSSGLSVYDFMKRSTFVGASVKGLRDIGPAAAILATEEGLAAHALSVQIRLDDPDLDSFG